MDAEAVRLLVASNKQLAILDAVYSRRPNINFFVFIYVCKEALMSSQSVGAQATWEDVFDSMLDEHVKRDVISRPRNLLLKEWKNCLSVIA
mgnify:CR=1 FL=1